MRALSIISPSETARLLRLYACRRTGGDATVYGVFEGPDLVYWSLSRKDANKKAERWGLPRAEVVGKTKDDLLKFAKE